MLPYVATEKDCLGEAECTICFEEFEIGDIMARKSPMLYRIAELCRRST